MGNGRLNGGGGSAVHHIFKVYVDSSFQIDLTHHNPNNSNETEWEGGLR